MPLGNFIINWRAEVKKNWNRKYTVNDHFFKRWSRNMAYILGLWFADGCILIGKEKQFGPSFSITLHKDDKYLLEKILKIMKSDYPLRQNKNCFSFSICSEDIVSDILKIGGKPHKSLDVNYPPIPSEYIADFIRGNFDGDGSIWKDNRTKSSYDSCFSSGSKSFLVGLRKDLVKYIPNINPKLKNQHINGRTYYLLKLNVNDTRRLRDFIYRNKRSLKMERKYERHIKNGKIRIPDRDKKRALFLTFLKAKNFIRKQKINNLVAWWNYCKTKKPPFIPSLPHKTYRGDGWTNWYDWLGKKNLKSKSVKAI